MDVCFQFSWWIPSREAAGLKGDLELSGIGHLFKEKDLVQDPESLLNNRRTLLEKGEGPVWCEALGRVSLSPPGSKESYLWGCLN